MGKTTFTHVEQSIWRTNAGKYQVRVVSSKGKQKRVKVTVPTLAEARLMRDAADQARSDGRCVRVACSGTCAGVRRIPPMNLET